MRRWCGTCGADLPGCFCTIAPRNPNALVGLGESDYDDERETGIRTKICGRCGERFHRNQHGAGWNYCAPCRPEHAREVMRDTQRRYRAKRKAQQ